MLVVSTHKSVSLVFVDKKDLRTVVEHLETYLANTTEPDDAVRVYTIADTRIPDEEVRAIANFTKDMFQHERSESVIQS